MGSAHPLNAPYQAFATADGWIVIGGSNQKNWLNALKTLDADRRRPALADNAARMAHLKELRTRSRPAKSRTSADCSR
jgi:crotonobetainyl-CoA:carnitine CoA-transferase CaiB-like acyl-CoA transferase